MPRQVRILICFSALFVCNSVAQADEVDRLIKSLGDPNNRHGAAIALKQLGKKAVPALQRELGSRDSNGQVWSAYALGEIGKDASSAVPDLIRALSDDDSALRATAAQSLGKIQDPAAVQSLARVLKDKKTEVRIRAASALGQFGSRATPASTTLIAALTDPLVRSSARGALIRIGCGITDELVMALQTDTIRFDALFVLRNVNLKKARELGLNSASVADKESLRIVLFDISRSPADRKAAAHALAQIGREGMELLIQAFEDKGLAEMASAACVEADSREVPLLTAALQHENSTVRASAARALGFIEPKAEDTISSLTKALAGQDREVRYQVVRALHTFGHKADPAVAALTEVILNPRETERTRQWAIKTLVVMSPENRDDVVAALIKASSDKMNYGVSQLAKQQLKKMDPKAAEAAGIK